MSTVRGGICVGELTEALAGPHADMLLGNLGAHVTQAERPGVGALPFVCCASPG
ncbi:MAG TPA: CoA transferase [Terracidiphilus sp.]|nr:CoA transferase [Terracidiphilus sp.]